MAAAMERESGTLFLPVCAARPPSQPAMQEVKDDASVILDTTQFVTPGSSFSIFPLSVLLINIIIAHGHRRLNRQVMKDGSAANDSIGSSLTANRSLAVVEVDGNLQQMFITTDALAPALFLLNGSRFE